MFARFSVKKPLTVLVAVILVIILGVVSFTKMTPDLLPNLELPYVVVLTAYVGASPEEIEQTITKPIEQATATLDNIKNIRSVSAENYSMVMLEFTDGANMDAATMNIREKLERIGGAWNASIGTPAILKLNPDMLPLAVAAVSRAGDDALAISAFTESTLLSRLEGVEGVASVSATGLIARQANVVLNERKTAAVNRRIAAALESSFADAEKELRDAQRELDKNQSELDDGLEQVTEGRKTLDEAKERFRRATQSITEKAGEASVQLDAARAQAEDAVKQLSAGVVGYDAAIAGLKGARAARAQAVAAQKAAQAQAAQLRILVSAISGQTPPYPQGVQDLLTGMGFAADESAAVVQTAELAAQRAASDAGDAIASIDARFPSLEADLAAAEGARGQLDAQRAQAQSLLDEIIKKRNELDTSMSMVAAEEAKAYNKIARAEKELDAVDPDQMEAAQKQLDDARKQLDDAKEQLAQQKKQLLSQTDMNVLLSRATVGGILSAENFSMPAGYAEDGERSWLVYVGDRVRSADEVASLVLFDLGLDGLEPIRVSDVADVFVSDNADETYAKLNGREGVLLSFQKQSGYATATVSENLEAEFSALCDEYDGLTFTMMMDQGDYIHLVIDSVLQNLLLGAVLAVVILYLFLRDLKPTFIIACSIPVSVTFAIVLMYFSGVTLNVISMSGLAVGVGMLVDNSIVVIENIYRLRKNGAPLYRACISGALQVSGAITASTLTTVCVFVPIVFVTGLARQIFTDMALTIAYSLLASLVVALTLVPAMSSGLLKKVRETPQKGLARMTGFYQRTLAFALAHKWLPLVLSVSLLAGSLVLALSRGFIYMPDMDSSQITIAVTLDDNATLAETAAVTDEVAARVSELPGVEAVGAMVGSGLGGVVGLSDGSDAKNETIVYAVLAEKRGETSLALARRMEALCADLPATVTATGTSSLTDASTLGGSGVVVQVYGENLVELAEAARAVAATLASAPGLVDVDDGIDKTTPALRVTVDKEAAMAHNLTVAQVYQDVAAFLSVNGKVTTLEDAEADVIFSLAGGARTLTDLRRHALRVKDASGDTKQVLLADIASFSESETLNSIGRLGQKRYLSVSAAVDEGYNVTLVAAEAEKALEAFTPPAGVHLVFSGENETIMSAMKDLLLMLLLGVVIVYLIMVAQFQSLLSPLIVMGTVPLAFTGGLLALLLAGETLSIVAMIGFILLVGIIVNNGIVLIDAANRLRMAGRELGPALRAACLTRLRPVLMTALTTILGLLPMALGFGMGASLVQPVAMVSIGGLAYATLMTLYVVPVLYEALCKRPPRVVSREELALLEEDATDI